MSCRLVVSIALIIQLTANIAADQWLHASSATEHIPFNNVSGLATWSLTKDVNFYVYLTVSGNFSTMSDNLAVYEVFKDGTQRLLLRCDKSQSCNNAKVHSSSGRSIVKVSLNTADYSDIVQLDVAYSALQGSKITTCDDVYEFYNPVYSVLQCSVLANAVYWRIDNQMDWNSARTVCRQIDPLADLISIHNFEESSLAARLSAAANPALAVQPGNQVSIGWIGYYQPDNVCNEPFVWSDGTTDLLESTEQTYSVFAPGEPDCGFGGTQHCTQLWSYYPSTATWDDLACSTPLPALCKVPITQ